MITDEQIAEWSRRSVEAVINCEPGELKPQNVLQHVLTPSNLSHTVTEYKTGETIG